MWLFKVSNLHTLCIAQCDQTCILIAMLVYEHKRYILAVLQTAAVHMAVPVAVVHTGVTVAVVHMAVAAAVVVHNLVHSSVVGIVVDPEVAALGKALVLDMVKALVLEAAAAEVGCIQTVTDMERARAIRTLQPGSGEVGGHWGKVVAASAQNGD
jgi:hypothetical protein